MKRTLRADYGRLRQTPIAASGTIVGECLTRIEDGLNVALGIKVKVRAVQGKPDVGGLYVRFGKVQSMDRSGWLVEE